MSSSKSLFSLPLLASKTAAAVALLGAASAAQAVVTFTVAQVGANVVVSASGSLITSGFGSTALTNFLAGSTPSSGILTVGAPGNAYLSYGYAFSGATSFGSFIPTAASSGTGSDFGFNRTSGTLYVPAGYVSGSAVSGTATYDNTTLAAMGFTGGTYNVAYAFPFTGDSIVVNVPAVPVPEPGTYALMLAGLGVMGFMAGQRRQG
jgi:hypothetical protein